MLHHMYKMHNICANVQQTTHIDEYHIHNTFIKSSDQGPFDLWMFSFILQSFLYCLSEIMYRFVRMNINMWHYTGLLVGWSLSIALLVSDVIRIKLGFHTSIVFVLSV